MERDSIRLECLKLAVSKNTDHKEAMIKAKEYVDFVEDAQKAVVVKPIQHNGNAQAL